MEDSNLQKSRQLIEDLSKGVVGSELEISTSKASKSSQPTKDQNGNWQAGAIATMIDNVGAIAVHSLGGPARVSLDFSVSYFSTAKFKEEIEIEAKVVKERGRLILHVVEVRRKNGGELIAIGKQWMASKGQASTSRL
ncbi:hypothetical protein L484_026226 [Morus notabilis]|uniref:Thioesterase domain-containing protein n=1 Tax=Morus notabilis TaxID=981085 RepID=W9REG0_9ROSA|nr:uncharacterized protein LOC21408889 [Morus notabilis]EXB74529.1 hypothetical protein L484_026226 [Morus notabilis]